MASRRVIASDGFSHRVFAGLGSATSGGAWRVSKARSARVIVKGGTARFLRVPRGTSTAAWLPRAAARNVDARFTVALSVRPARAAGTYLAAEARKQPNGSAYRGKITFTKSGQPRLVISRAGSHGRDTALRTLGLHWHVRAGQRINVEIMVTGTSPAVISARAWPAGARTPQWQATVRDASAARITQSGSVGFWGYRSRYSAATGWRLDAMKAWSLVLSQAGSPPPPVTNPTPPVTDPTPRSPGQPGPDNTGVPAGTQLTVVQGTLKITEPGVYSGLDVHGFVHVTAPNVTLRNSIIRGGVATSDIALVNVVVSTATDFVIEDSELVPQYPSVYIDGITGWNYTARRLNIHGTVDGAKIFGSDTTIDGSWIHDLHYYSSDPNQGGKPSHNDAVQVLGGRNLHITGNTLDGGSNAALQVTQSRGEVSNLAVTGNWAGGGACTVNLQDAPLSSMSGVSVSANRFARTSQYNCPILAYSGVTVTTTENTWSDGSAPVPVTRRTD